MRVVVYAQDLSGRRDDGYYTKSNISSALDIFYFPEGTKIFADPNGENEMSRDCAEELFKADRRVEFYNTDGEKMVISVDPSTTA